MSIEENKAVFRAWIGDTDAPSGVLDWTERWMTSDFRAHLPGAPQPLDLAAYRAFSAAFQHAFRSEGHVIQDIVAEGDMVAGRITFHVVNIGAFQGFPATGQKIALAETVFAKIRGGKVAEVWTLVDRGQFAPAAS